MMAEPTCTGRGTTPCVSPREKDKARCLAVREVCLQTGDSVALEDLALRLHAGDSEARAAIEARFDVLRKYLMLRGGTTFLRECRDLIAESRWYALAGVIDAMEWAHIQDGNIRRNPDDSTVPLREGDYSIPKNIDPGGPLFLEGA